MKNSLNILEYLQSEIQREEENYRESLRQRKIFAELKIIRNRIKKIKEVISNIQKQRSSYSDSALPNLTGKMF